MTATNDFLCDACRVVVEAGRGSDDPPACPDCGDPMRLIFTKPPSVQARKTPGWKDSDPHADNSDIDKLMDEYEDFEPEEGSQTMEDLRALGVEDG